MPVLFSTDKCLSLTRDAVKLWRILLGSAAICCTAGTTAWASDRAFETTLSLNLEQLVSKYDFGVISAIEQEFRRERARTANGQYKLEAFYGWFEAATNPNNVLQPPGGTIEDGLNEWAKQQPESAAPRIALAIYYKNYARHLRRTARYHALPGATMQSVRIYFTTALKTVAAARKYDPTHPHALAVHLQIKDAEHRPVAELLKEHAERANAPGVSWYLPVHYSVLDALVRQVKKPGATFRDRERIQKFIADQTGKLTGTQIGKTFYARAYWRLMHRHFGDRALSHTGVDWALLRPSLSALVAAYPTRFNKNTGALMACFSGHPVAANAFWPHMGPELVKAIWKNPVVYQACDEWRREALGRGHKL